MVLCLNPAFPPQWNRSSSSHLLVPGRIQTSCLEIPWVPELWVLFSVYVLLPEFLFVADALPFLRMSVPGMFATCRRHLDPEHRRAASCVFCKILLSECSKWAQHQDKDARRCFLFFWDSMLSMGYTWVLHWQWKGGTLESRPKCSQKSFPQIPEYLTIFILQLYFIL